MLRDILKGSTDQSVIIRIVDSGDGTPETGVTSATSGLDLKYRREGATPVNLTESDLAAVDSAHADGGMIHIGAGYYRVDPPDAAWATGANGVMVFGTVTGMVVIGCYVHLVDYDPQNAVRLGLTALPNAAAEAAGGLYTRGTGAGQIAQDSNGTARVRLADAAHGGTAAVITAERIVVASATSNEPAVKLTGNGTGAGLLAQGGASGNGITGAAGATQGTGISGLGSGTGHGIAGEGSSGGDGIAGYAPGSGRAGIAGYADDGDGIRGLSTMGGADISGDITGNITGNLSGSAGSVTGNVGGNVTGTIGGLTAAALKDFFDTDSGDTYAGAVSGSVVKEIADNAGGSALTVQDIVDGVWDEDATGHQTQGTFGQAIGDPAADANTIYGAVVTGAAGATIAADIVDIEGKVDDLETRLGTPSDLGSGATVAANLVDIEAQTDDIGTAGAGLTAVPWNAAWDAEVESEANDALVAQNLDHLVKSAVDTDFATTVQANSVIGHLADNGAGFDRTTDSLEAIRDRGDAAWADSGTPPTAAAIADAVWDEPTAGHTTSGTFGEQAKTDIDAILADTNELQTDWVNGGRLDNILDARASQTSVDDLPTNAELATALAGADDAVLAAIAALNNLSQADVRTAVGLATNNLDTQLDALPTALENADALLKRDWSAVTGEATRSALNALRFLRNKWSIAGGTLTVTEEDDATPAWTGAVTQTAGNPVSEIDPA